MCLSIGLAQGEQVGGEEEGHVVVGLGRVALSLSLSLSLPLSLSLSLFLASAYLGAAGWGGGARMTEGARGAPVPSLVPRCTAGTNSTTAASMIGASLVEKKTRKFRLSYLNYLN